MTSLSDFLGVPSEVFVHKCTKKQLIQIAEHYEINADGKKCKAEIKSVVLATLLEGGVVSKGEPLLVMTATSGVPLPVPFSVSLPSRLTFEQQWEW